MSTRQRKFYSLELGRGIAALAVVLYHIDKYYFRSEKYWTDSLFGGLFAFGHSGVDFFFVLSGFIMIWAHSDDIGKPGRAASFLKNRTIRIYPLLWASTFALFVMYLLVPSAGEAEYRSMLTLTESLALFGRDPLGAINFPSWTLWHENLFYLFCLTIIARPRLGIFLFGLWSITCAVLGLVGPLEGPGAYALAPVNSLFCLGAGAAWWLLKRRLPAPRFILLIGILGFTACASFSLSEVGQHKILMHALFGFSSLLIVAGAVDAERRGLIALPQFAVGVGALSYPVYLSHMVTLPPLAKILLMLNAPQWLPSPFAGLLMAVCTVLVAWAVHRLFERPVAAWLRKEIGGTHRDEPPSTASV